MLKYSVKLTENDFKDNHLVWREKYVAPDLSFISGVTDSSYHLEQFNQLPAYNSYTNQSAILNIDTEVVTRLGYVIAKEKEYPVKTVTFSGQTYNYIQVNGKYYYDNNGYNITNWQVERYKRRRKDDGTKEYYSVIEERTVTATSEENASGISVVKLDTIYWIEDGFVNIDGVQYIFDKNEVQSDGKQGCIKFTDKGGSIENVTNCSSIYYMPYTSITQIHDACKFTATCESYRTILTNSIDYSEYFFYVKYKNNYCPIIISGGTFMCEIPNNVLDPLNGDPTKTTTYNVYYNETEDNPSGETLTVGGNIYDVSDLYGIEAFTYISGGTSKFYVQNDYRKCNSSRDVMIDLTRDVEQFVVGDTLTLENVSEEETYIDIEDDNGLCILYDGKRYNVKPNLFDKASISGETYDIEYDAFDNVNAYVIIDGERVPMKRTKKEGESGETLVRYGKVIGYDGKPTSGTADVEYYSGVTIDNVDYEVEDNTELSAASKCIVEGGNRIKLKIIDIKGNSLLICEPYIDENEFTSEYIYNKQYALASELVKEQNSYGALYKNGIFGEMPVTEDLAFLYTSTPKSSDDYYNLFDDLVIETKTGYINLPLTFGTSTSNNIVQGDLIEKEFVEKERKSHINRVVDMEKDVYIPKYLSGGTSGYSGSSTDFMPIYKINFNLHFRTRNMTNWKVNDGNTDVSVSGTADNWFITDYEPYKSIIESALTDNTLSDEYKDYVDDLMMETSDLLYLLYFTDDDVYYQKSRLAKSFLRISIYDSIDPQTQSLLATSTVFVNEHDLFKKYIDYSRRGINKFLMINENSFVETNKIKTRTEMFALSKKGKCSGESVVNYDEEWYKDGFGRNDGGEGDYKKGYESGICINFDESVRLSSRLVVDNKYDTDTSSEGFYIYMFREYSKKLHPKDIYMKIEYNHAGVGKTIPLFVPMNLDDEKNPERLTFKDLEELKKGIPLDQVYKQSYIPLKAVYDFKNKEYAYMFDEHYIEPIENGVLNLNLFEMKISTEEEVVTGGTATRTVSRTMSRRNANPDNSINIDINNYFGV